MATLRTANGLTIAEANKGTQLSIINRENKPLGVILMSKVVDELRYYVPMNAPANIVADWSENILSDFWYLKFEEVILALKEGATHKQYGEILLSNIYEWIRAYEKRKEEYLMNEHLKTKETYDGRGTGVDFKEAIKLTEADYKAAGIIKE